MGQCCVVSYRGGLERSWAIKASAGMLFLPPSNLNLLYLSAPSICIHDDTMHYVWNFGQLFLENDIGATATGWSQPPDNGPRYSTEIKDKETKHIDFMFGKGKLYGIELACGGARIPQSE